MGLGCGLSGACFFSRGRYRYQDDWETPDTQVISIDFDNNTSMTWEGRSCNGHNVADSSVGVIFYGEKGALQINGGNSYTLYDLKNNVIKEVKHGERIDARNTANPAQNLDAYHIHNFFDCIRKGAPLASGIVGGHKSTLLCQLGNIAHRVGSSLDINPQNGRILNNKEALKYWSREYEPGWEPEV